MLRAQTSCCQARLTRRRTPRLSTSRAVRSALGCAPSRWAALVSLDARLFLDAQVTSRTGRSALLVTCGDAEGEDVADAALGGDGARGQTADLSHCLFSETNRPRKWLICRMTQNSSWCLGKLTVCWWALARVPLSRTPDQPEADWPVRRRWRCRVVGMRGRTGRLFVR